MNPCRNHVSKSAENSEWLRLRSIRARLSSFLFIGMWLAMFAVATGQSPDVRGLNGLEEISFDNLSDKRISPLGQVALSIRPADWKHAETTNFVYHFFHGFIATPVSVEAEFYYRVIAKELHRETTEWERKCHIFVFESPEDWRTFQERASLDPWTGGIHSGGDLFIIRNPQFKFKGHALGHEVTHLVIYRFFGAGVPLWLNEGCAEYVSLRGYAAFMRARGYLARPKSYAVAPDAFIPLSTLTDLATYPSDENQVSTFYHESEKLVRFLCVESSQNFVTFFDGMAHGNRIDTALWKGFGSRFPSLDSLDREFRVYATKDYAPSSDDQTDSN